MTGQQASQRTRVRLMVTDPAKARRVIDGMYCLICDAPLPKDHRYEVCSMSHGWSPVPLPPGEWLRGRLYISCSAAAGEAFRDLAALPGGWLGGKMTAEKQAQFARHSWERADGKTVPARRQPGRR